MNLITSFRGEYVFLSNFYPAAVSYEGKSYPTVEHAYQAAKTTDKEVRYQISRAKSAMSANQLGRNICMLRVGWDEMKLTVMEYLLRQKFQTDPLRTKLLATGDATLIEGNDWGDYYWGQVKGVGDNNLGILLMKIREELQCGK